MPADTQVAARTVPARDPPGRASSSEACSHGPLKSCHRHLQPRPAPGCSEPTVVDRQYLDVGVATRSAGFGHGCPGSPERPAATVVKDQQRRERRNRWGGRCRAGISPAGPNNRSVVDVDLRTGPYSLSRACAQRTTIRSSAARPSFERSAEVDSISCRVGSSVLPSDNDRSAGRRNPFGGRRDHGRTLTPTLTTVPLHTPCPHAGGFAPKTEVPHLAVS